MEGTLFRFGRDMFQTKNKGRFEANDTGKSFKFISHRWTLYCHSITFQENCAGLLALLRNLPLLSGLFDTLLAGNRRKIDPES
ncbi:hypothetical protein TorRG33x02_005640 [Trema orientale]|uniref:Uncharacterized protein n=1 Tax=Trema orientale TaxID=63057 RepID=A0A2P5G023_TREOI|nr:hypothetical protein TorRG33x02_005640 [Trema orientale]